MEPNPLSHHALAYYILIRRLLLELLPHQIEANVIPERIFPIILLVHAYRVIHVKMFRVLISTFQRFAGN